MPSDVEWKELEMYLGMSQTQADDYGNRGTDEGGKLKETGTKHWCNPNIGATNESGFTALPGGSCYDFGGYNGSNFYALFWTSTDYYSDNSAIYRSLENSSSEIHRNYDNKRCGFSVRCIKD